jgi:hypothetical protein
MKFHGELCPPLVNDRNVDEYPYISAREQKRISSGNALHLIASPQYARLNVIITEPV